MEKVDRVNTVEAEVQTPDQDERSKEACEIIACTLLNRYIKEREAEKTLA
ncbi:hypothetical protein ACFL5E_04135 [Candidatus Omnitrophota bacterium]